MASDTDRDKCPSCGGTVTSLDDPCPHCLHTEGDNGEDVPYTYFKTFKNRTSFRYRPDDFVSTVNDWLSDETGLLNVDIVIHRVHGGLIGGVTLSCLGCSQPTGRLFQIDRVVLSKGTISQKAKPLGEALNEWNERNPDKQLLRFVSIGVATVVIEVWILFLSVAPDPALSADGVQAIG
jgi:hypothetical protein